MYTVEPLNNVTLGQVFLFIIERFPFFGGYKCVI